MRRKIKTGLLGLIGGAALYVFGCGNRIAPENLPANNIEFGRQMEVYSEDAAHGFRNSLEFDVDACHNGADAHVYPDVVEDRNGRSAPFDTYVNCALNGNNTQDCTLSVKPNGGFFVSGEIWTVNVNADCPGLDHDSQRTIYVTYNDGESPAELDDRLDHVEQVVLHYVVNNGVCEEAYGENYQNSPHDCATDNPQPPMSLDDFVCNLPRAQDNESTSNYDEGADLMLMKVKKNGSTYTNAGEVAEISPDKLPDAHYKNGLTVRKLSSGQTAGIRYAMTMGTSLGNITDITFEPNLTSGYRPNECDDVFILNPNGEKMPAGDYRVTAFGTLGTTAEIIRVTD